MKKDNLDRRNWKERFFKTVPMVDSNGDPIPQDPPLNRDGFWEKPQTTATILNEQINKHKK